MSKISLANTLLAVVPIAGLLVGCDGGGRGNNRFDFSGLTGDDEVRYRCDGGRGFRVTYGQDGDRATVDIGDETYRLDLEDRDGRRRIYGGKKVTLTVNGDEARLGIDGDKDYTDCQKT